MKINRLLLTGLLLLPPTVLAAGPITPPVEGGSNLDFSLRLASAKTPLTYAGRTQDTTSRWIGVGLREAAGKHIVLGMYGGYAYTTQTDNPLTAGLELDGYHAGLSIHGFLPLGRSAQLYGAFEYTYQRVKHEAETQNIVLDWVRPQAQLGVLAALSPRWRVYGGANYGKIDGEERANGSVNHTLAFDRGARVGGVFGIDLNWDAGGYVGIELRSGIDRGGEIYFKRVY